MHKQETRQKSHETRQHDECCDHSDCQSGLRNNYFQGKRLTPESFRVEQRYQVDRRRLLNRSLHGWGVVYGYGIEPVTPDHGRQKVALKRLPIEPGLALDVCGHELLLVEPRSLGMDDVIILDWKGDRVDRVEDAIASIRPNSQRGATCWLFRVHYAEQLTGQTTQRDPCSCERSEWDGVCETVRFSLQPVECALCCSKFPCELGCKCSTGKCCGEHRRQPEVSADTHDHIVTGDLDGGIEPHAFKERQPCEPYTRGGCRCLCEHVSRQPDGVECCKLTDIHEPCATVKVDLRNGVPLACFELITNECDEQMFSTSIDACGPRRLVKNNDLLFDLIRGCDLTRIIEIGWKDLHRNEEFVPFDRFSKALGPLGDDNDEYVTAEFWVKFSRPVCKDSLRADCFAMTVLGGEAEGGWWRSLRVPIERVDTEKVPAEPDDPPGHVRSARIVVNGGWLEDAVRGRNSIFLVGNARVEIEIRGDFIIDCNGQPVDANPVGLSSSSTGNGTPGGTFISTFRVEKRVDNRKKSAAQQVEGAKS